MDRYGDVCPFLSQNKNQLDDCITSHCKLWTGSDCAFIFMAEEMERRRPILIDPDDLPNIKMP